MEGKRRDTRMKRGNLPALIRYIQIPQDPSIFFFLFFLFFFTSRFCLRFAHDRTQPIPRIRRGEGGIAEKETKTNQRKGGESF